MSREVNFEDLKGEAECAVRSLRYLHRVMFEHERPDDLEHCFEMAQSYIKQIADDLDGQINLVSDTGGPIGKVVLII